MIGLFSFLSEPPGVKWRVKSWRWWPAGVRREIREAEKFFLWVRRESAGLERYVFLPVSFFYEPFFLSSLEPSHC